MIRKKKQNVLCTHKNKTRKRVKRTEFCFPPLHMGLNEMGKKAKHCYQQIPTRMNFFRHSWSRMMKMDGDDDRWWSANQDAVAMIPSHPSFCMQWLRKCEVEKKEDWLIMSLVPLGLQPIVPARFVRVVLLLYSANTRGRIYCKTTGLCLACSGLRPAWMEMYSV